ncbi:MAG: asparagine synthase (glutamine-hydrolyzing) [Myxococcales bacterium]|nr:asparagine synthase (glutamine-hydrolyzing) [Myxococcales bacterium]
MCGIAGVVGYREDGRTDTREVTALRDAQSHRGPDDAGTWISPDGRVGLGHRRLSIIDLSPGGHQPMAAAGGRYQLVFNGEIYNFEALRAELQRLGFAFQSQSDTEVILHGYRAWGRGLLGRLRGMFAFALHDRDERETLLARDPLGIKPLYTLDDGSRLCFASEVQALRSVVGGGDVDPEGLASYLRWGSIVPPRTLYSRIRALPAGCWQRVRDRSVDEPTEYFRIEDCFGAADEMDEEEAHARLRDALLESARAHLVSDVPVGVFLSGGVDSAALLGLMSETGEASLRTITLAFDVEGLDESALARTSADLYGSEHTEVKIGVDEIGDRMPDAIRSLDQPTVDGVNSYFVSEAAVRAGLKVAIAGVGGDELFGGYGSFARIPRIRRTHDALSRLPLLQPAHLARGVDALPAWRWRSRMSLALDFGGSPAGAYFAERGINTAQETRALLAPELADAADAYDPVDELARRLRAEDLPEEERVSAFELRQYLQVQLLRDIDAVSMRHSLEVRPPLVDCELLRAVAKIPARHRLSGPAKRMLREAPRPPVANAIWNRTKQGFTLPFDHWLRTGRIALDLPEHPCLQGAAVQRVRDGFERGNLHFSRVWQLLVLRDFLT